MVTALTTDKAQEETCVATVSKNRKEADLFFRVRCCPVVLEKKRLLLFFLQDCTIQQQQAALEYLFFHDIQNLISALKLNSQLLDTQNDPAHQTESIARIGQIARQLDREIEVQRSLITEESHAFHLLVQDVDVSSMVNELKSILSTHPVSQDKTLSLLAAIQKNKFSSDITLLKRILAKMIINAFEATPSGGAIYFWVEQTNENVSFYVWNEQAIPPEQGLRIFQRNYAPKQVLVAAWAPTR
jgi:signal transduction histidine kinase